MIYLYNCLKCGVKEIEKHHKDSGKTECCNCGLKMERIFTVPQVATKDLYTGYNPALGKVISNKAHLREELYKFKEKTGTELVEVGNSCANVKKDNKLNLDLTPAEMQKAGEILQSIEG